VGSYLTRPPYSSAVFDAVDGEAQVVTWGGPMPASRMSAPAT
jgi:hypothetical protein